jgi:hypothetical protein
VPVEFTLSLRLRNLSHANASELRALQIIAQQPQRPLSSPWADSCPALIAAALQQRPRVLRRSSDVCTPDSVFWHELARHFGVRRGSSCRSSLF